MVDNVLKKKEKQKKKKKSHKIARERPVLGRFFFLYFLPSPSLWSQVQGGDLDEILVVKSEVEDVNVGLDALRVGGLWNGGDSLLDLQ